MKILRALADAHRRRQEALSRALAAEYRSAQERYQATAPGTERERAWSATIVHMIHRYGAASAELAAEYYADARKAAGVPGAFDVPVAGPPPIGQITASRRAVRASASRRPSGDADDGKAAQQWEAVQAERDLVRVQRLAAQAGRRTIEKAARADPQAVGWRRVTTAGCCAFCALLAVNGLVYTDQRTAARREDGEPYHDRCHCHAEPAFRGVKPQPQPQVDAWEELYYEASHGVYGSEKLTAFRRAFDAKHRSRPPADRATT
ncbi:hypothetical protein [Streptomyces sp. NPDC053079]|uniref:VG15 protein n=1 Tax=Streptomyces sp. NPDC053079 TaxID=3365697 RepID=UPI0037D635BF